MICQKVESDEHKRIWITGKNTGLMRASMVAPNGSRHFLPASRIKTGLHSSSIRRGLGWFS